MNSESSSSSSGPLVMMLTESCIFSMKHGSHSIPRSTRSRRKAAVAAGHVLAFTFTKTTSANSAFSETASTVDDCSVHGCQPPSQK